MEADMGWVRLLCWHSQTACALICSVIRRRLQGLHILLCRPVEFCDRSPPYAARQPKHANMWSALGRNCASRLSTFSLGLHVHS